MKLPEAISAHLEAWIFEQRRPLCMRVGADDQLVELWGEPRDFGLEAIGPGEDVKLRLPLIADYEGGEHIELPFVTDATGHSYHVHIVPDGSDRYILLLDATKELEERRRYQQTANEVRLALHKERRLLAELVDAHAELVLRRKEAEAESRRRGEYIATMSHEFRTPMTSILAHAQTIGEQAQSPQSRESALALARVAQRQLWVIDNLLARARLDADGFHARPGVTDVRRFADELALVFAPLAGEKGLSFGVSLERSVPDFLRVDALHLRQVLVNLVGNAIKFTREGSIAVRFDFAGGELSIEVVDTGPGMDQATLASAFAPYSRGREEPSAPGAGLGLGIAQRLVEALGGRVVLTSQPGQGTTARLAVPAEPVGGANSAEKSAGARIFVCDDDEDITDLLQLRLADAGFEVVVTSNAAELIEAVRRQPPALVIIDLNMPDMSGPDAARRLREEAFLAPIIMLSGSMRRDDVEFALASGCTEFVHKPPQMSALTRLIRQLLLAEDSRAGDSR